MRVDLFGVSKWFGSTCALRDVTVSIAPGDHIALVGPNGSGKSTLMRAMLGLVACEGSIRIDQKDAFRERALWAQHVVYVPQVPPRTAMTVRELVWTLCAVRGLDSKSVFEMGGRLNLDVDALLGKPFQALSGGTKQKVLLALALAVPARLILLDEPTASLDATSRASFFGLFHEHAAGATVILCSHRPDELGALANQVLALDEGRVRHWGPLVQLGEDDLAVCLSARETAARSDAIKGNARMNLDSRRSGVQ
jgi:ABC-type multidrug transport system ATPase subunit